MTSYWMLNEAETAIEDFGSEFIIVHFRKGIYSAVSGSGGPILTLLSAPRSIADIVAAFGSLTGDRQTMAATEIEAFIEVLKDLDLIVEADGPSPVPATAIEEPYEAPSIETFSDLADLMAIDPVHEVEMGAGWPHRPKQPDS